MTETRTGVGSEKNWLLVLGSPPRQSYAVVKERRDTSGTGKKKALAAATWCVAGFTEAVTDLHGPQCLTSARRSTPVTARHPRVPRYGQDTGGGSGMKPLRASSPIGRGDVGSRRRGGVGHCFCDVSGGASQVSVPARPHHPCKSALGHRRSGGTRPGAFCFGGSFLRL